MNSPKLSPLMVKAIERMKQTGGGHFYGDHGIYESTLDALIRRGLATVVDRMDRVLKFERRYVSLKADR